MKDIISTIQGIVDLLFSKAIISCSFILGIVLTEIGYPKDVLIFIFALVLIDILTKQYAVVKKNYGSFSLFNYFLGWKNKKLTSRELKNGIGVKAILYMAVLYMAHKASVVAEVLYGDVISNTLYSLLIFVECTSILENFILAGNDYVKPLLTFLKQNEKEVIDSIKEELKKQIENKTKDGEETNNEL